ncbi:MAG: DEAD/DEAH box helicase [Planctomycetes bacterium]|nr:DEAD/DEAH box helicase [Planctomycetota bacterium]MBU4400863.1 DEAD/DEAH box helicase [Planctomycetota bacterium]MCG2682246.1 DEAD/DEAH box helicase [Planctomycetales bacterium]
MTFHWHAPPPPETQSIDLTFSVRRYGGPVTVVGPPCRRPLNFEFARPRVVSIPITRPPVRTRSFRFAEPDVAQPPPAVSKNLHGRAASNGALGGHTRIKPPGDILSGHTRIKPPNDIIKLSDRLEYLLQPSLESLLDEGLLAFPQRPFPFQFEGIAFLYPRQAAILADEMGLGKTMQAITAIRLLLRRDEVKSVLLVCPKPLVTNWRREFEHWAPEVPVIAIEGDQAKRNWQWRLPDVPVRIANYELLLRDLGGSMDGSDLHFDLVVLDESQRIKNRASSTNRIVRSISRRRSWALTGTPVENSVEDLLGIFEFLAPGFLSPEMKPRSIGRSIGDHVLRRTKEQVLADLPAKLVHDAPLDLTPQQRESYRLAEEKGVVRLTELGKSAAIQHVFELVLRLKQICNFDSATGASAKLERLDADLEEIAESGRKAIVFSQWVGTLRILSRRLERFGPMEYHGQVPFSRRDSVISRFREDPSRHVMLISYGAGGVGLNLQFVNYVFLFDRWWNPAVEDQAINRAHRIGVDGPVCVTRFLMVDTIEERIDGILREKRELFDSIFSGTEDRRKLGLTQEELFGLFRLKCPSGPIDLAA